MNRAKLKYKFRMFLRALPYHFLVMGSVFVIATIFNKYFEAVCFLTSFFSLRYKFPTTYHSKSIVICMALTISIFTLSIVICPPVYMYLLVSIFFAYLDCFMLWFIQSHLDLIAFNRQLTKEADKIRACLRAFEQDERAVLLNKCAKAGIGERNTKIAEMYYIQRKKPKQIWEWLCNNNENMEYDSVYILLNRLNKKLKAVSD